MLLVFLHGFWGQSQDAVPLFQALKDLKPERGLKLWAPDFFREEGPLSPRHSFDEWSANFEEALGSQEFEDGVVFVGYSLGGRLLVHALARLLRSKRAWPLRHAFFLSSNPGLIEPKDIAGRRRWEQAWMERFRHEDWESLRRDWNALSVFEASREAQRREDQFSRELLALALERWSVTRHERFLKDIHEVPQHWCFGLKDAKYKALGLRLKESGHPGQYVFFERGGHRLVLDVVEDLAKTISQSL